MQMRLEFVHGRKNRQSFGPMSEHTLIIAIAFRVFNELAHQNSDKTHVLGSKASQFRHFGDIFHQTW